MFAIIWKRIDDISCFVGKYSKFSECKKTAP